MGLRKEIEARGGGHAGTSSRPSDNADEATPLAPEGLVSPAGCVCYQNIKIRNASD